MNVNISLSFLEALALIVGAALLYLGLFFGTAATTRGGRLSSLAMLVVGMVLVAIGIKA